MVEEKRQSRSETGEDGALPAASITPRYRDRNSNLVIFEKGSDISTIL